MNSPCAHRIAALLTLFLFLVPLWSGMDKAGSPQQEGALLVYPELILKGAVPYRDFETEEGPANLYLLALPTAIFGADVFIERVVGVIYRMLLAGALFALLQRRGVVVAVGGTLLAGVFLLDSRVTAVSGLAAVACVLWCLWCAGEPSSRWRGFAGGLLAGLAFLFYPQAGLAGGLAAVPLVLALPPAHRRVFLFTAAACLTPVAGLVALAGWGPCFHCLVELKRHQPGTPHGPLLTLLLLHLAAMLLSFAAAWLHRGTREGRALLAVALLALGLSLEASAPGNLAFLSLAFLPAALALLFARLGKAGTGSFSLGPALSAAALVFLVSAACLPSFFRRAADKTWQQLRGKDSGATDLEGHHGRRFPLAEAATVMAAGPIVEDLEHLAKPGQRLFVGPGNLRQPRENDTFLYYLLPQLTPASYYLELHPRVSPGRLAAEIATADWLILNRAWDGPPSEPLEVVRTQFERCARHGTFELYRRKVRP